MAPFMTRVCSYTYVLHGTEENKEVGRLTITEAQEGNELAELDGATPRYGFELRDAEGRLLGMAAPGGYQAFETVVQAFLQGYARNDENFKARWTEVPDFALAPVHMMNQVMFAAAQPSSGEEVP